MVDVDVTFADTVGVSEDGALFDGAERAEDDPDIVFVQLLRDHPDEQFSF
jgi:hypothetical protein